MSEFERTKRAISGHSILITSWFDERQQTWQASAPDYAYLDALCVLGREGCSSREAAVKRLSTFLVGHFARE